MASYCLCHVLSNKTSENSTEKGAYQNAMFDILDPVSSTTPKKSKYPLFTTHLSK